MIEYDQVVGHDCFVVICISDDYVVFLRQCMI